MYGKGNVPKNLLACFPSKVIFSHPSVAWVSYSFSSANCSCIYLSISARRASFAPPALESVVVTEACLAIVPGGVDFLFVDSTIFLRV